MNTRHLLLLALISLAAPALSAPSLSITKPPVGGGDKAGPPNDPSALQGQWIQTPGDPPATTVRTHEFYDNVTGFGGGLASFNAIYGKATNLAYGAVNNLLLSFDIVATITNDTPASSLWLAGANSHGESLNTTAQYVGTLVDTVLCASFSLTAEANVPAQWILPYNDITPHIVSANHDASAWFCFNDNQGGYYVPTWDFGDIATGASVTRTLSFTVTGGLSAIDPRRIAIEQSAAAPPNQGDLLSNRTTSLKISDWLDTLALDTGVPYPTTEPEHGSDVSVFHNVPEPGSLLLAALGLGSALLPRRRMR